MGALAEFLNAVSAVFVLLMLMSVGYIMGKVGWMTDKEKRFLSKYIVNIAVPFNCLNGLLNNLDQAMLNSAGLMLIASVLGIVVTLLLSWGAAALLRLPNNRKGVFIAMASLSNTLFIGLPLSTQLFGEVCIPYVMIYYLANTFFVQTVGTILIERAGNVQTERTVKGFCKDIFSKPPIIGVLVSVLLLALDLRPPEVIMTFAKYISGSVSPMALVYCGFILYEVGLRNLRFQRGIPTMLVIRLLIAPVLCYGMCRLFGISGLALSVFTVESALPVVTQVTVLSGAFGADEKYAASGACISTLCCFVTIPVLMVLLG